MDDDTDVKGGSSQDLDGIIGGGDFDLEDDMDEADLGLDEESTDW
ncbi:MAG: hypothetical protein NTV48_00845 [Candidatus Vogelbacteria bacterium]|nr:hypothetical protein [Candidatus Vogelbacteria bacterium]